MDTMSDLNQTEELIRRAGRYPRLQAQILRMLDMVENADGDICTADAAEERAIEDLRTFGRELLQTWGQRYAEDAAARIVQEGGVAHQVKNFAGTAPSVTLRSLNKSIETKATAHCIARLRAPLACGVAATPGPCNG
jgi:hypothetical protein